MTETSASSAAGRAAAVLRYHQIAAFLLTFSAYVAFHASRKSPLHRQVRPPHPHRRRRRRRRGRWMTAIRRPPRHPSAGRAGSGLPRRLRRRDVRRGRADLRLLVAWGMLGSSAAAGAMVASYFLSVYRLWFFLAAQVSSGLFQCVVAVVSNWFGKSRRGLVMGVWGSHTSVGNILGSVVASAALGMGWGWSFVFPGALMGLIGVVVLK